MGILSRLTLCYLAIIGFSAADAIAQDFNPVTEDIAVIDKDYPPVVHELFIPVAGVKLTGFILLANGQGPHPTAVLIHGLPGNEKNLDLAQSLRRAGFNVLFFHYRGAWGSEGNYSFATIHEDVLAAFDFLRNDAAKYRVDVDKISVVGHSFGGYAALRSGTIDDDLTCIVALAAANPALIASSSRIDSKTSNNIGQYIDSLFMLNNFSGKQGIAELTANAKAMDTRHFGNKLKDKNLYLITGEQDTVVPPAIQKQVAEQYQTVKGLKFESHFIAGDHVFSVSRIKLQTMIIQWMNGHCR